jgi:hypothetical protein
MQEIAFEFLTGILAELEKRDEKKCIDNLFDCRLVYFIKPGGYGGTIMAYRESKREFQPE